MNLKTLNKYKKIILSMCLKQKTMTREKLEKETEKLVESFHKYLFYKFLHERGNVEEEQLSVILSACENPQRYIRRFALNKIMSNPEELKNTANPPDSRIIHLFYNISKTLNLFVVSAKNTLEVTPRIDLFTQLSSKERFAVLFDAMWNETKWAKNGRI